MLTIARTTLLLLGAGALACVAEFQTPATTPAKTSAGSRARSAGGAAGKPKGAAEDAQSYAEAWRVICEAERRSGADATQSREQRGAAVAGWIVDNLKSKRARYWFIQFGKVKDNREAVFRAEAVKAGVKDCALAGLLFGH